MWGTEEAVGFLKMYLCLAKEMVTITKIKKKPFEFCFLFELAIDKL